MCAELASGCRNRKEQMKDLRVINKTNIKKRVLAISFNLSGLFRKRTERLGCLDLRSKILAGKKDRRKDRVAMSPTINESFS